MQTLKMTMPTFFDVDDTLILWAPTRAQQEKYRNVICPETTMVYTPYTPNVDQLIEHKRRGHTIVVWSAGGVEWARRAVKMLGLENCVDYVMDKPRWYYDDKHAGDFMGNPHFISEELYAKRCS